jgi:hypothetical protein
MNPVHNLSPCFTKIHSNIISHLHLVFRLVPFLQDFRPICYICFLSLPCVLHAHLSHFHRFGSPCDLPSSSLCGRAVITQSVQRWATGWTIGVLGFDSRLGLGIFLFTTASRTALRTTQPPIQWVPGALSLGVKRPGREADHSPSSSAEVKECVELYLHSPIRLHGMVLS